MEAKGNGYFVYVCTYLPNCVALQRWSGDNRTEFCYTTFAMCRVNPMAKVQLEGLGKLKKIQ
jgi:hypothetical protein